MMFTDMNFIFHKEKDDKVMVSYMYGWIGQKDGDDLASLMWEEG